MAESSFFSKLRDDPATKALLNSLSGFATAQGVNVANRAMDRFSGGGKSDDDDADKSDQIKGGAMEGAGEAMGEGKSKIFGGIKGALKGLFKTGGTSKRPTNIYEQIFIGVPVEKAFAEWTNYSQFPEFMKGPESVKVTEEEGEDGEVKETHQWTAKIFLNRRSWKATVEEEVENKRVRWSTEAAKGTIDGVITFTPIGDNATLMLYSLEYRPKGFFEWWGNRWRTVGRRARLDVKHFGRHVMMLPADEEETDETEEPEDATAEAEGVEGADRDDPGRADTDEEPEDEDEEAVVDATTTEAEDAGEPEQSRQPDERRRPRKPRQPREER